MTKRHRKLLILDVLSNALRKNMPNSPRTSEKSENNKLKNMFDLIIFGKVWFTKVIRMPKTICLYYNSNILFLQNFVTFVKVILNLV